MHQHEVQKYTSVRGIVHMPVRGKVYTSVRDTVYNS
jgi:hypothetical protein